jgi:hypothetical protein
MVKFLLKHWQQQVVFLFFETFQLALESTQCHVNGNHGSFLGVKWPGLEANSSLPYSAEIKSEWNYTSTPPYAFIVQTRTTLPLLYTLNYMGPGFISVVVFLMPFQVMSPDT